MAKKKYLKLSSPADVRKSMNRVANMLLNDQIEPKKANALIYACNSTLNSIRADEYDKRIAELEEMLEEAGLL